MFGARTLRARSGKFDREFDWNAMTDIAIKPNPAAPAAPRITFTCPQEATINHDARRNPGVHVSVWSIIPGGFHVEPNALVATLRYVAANYDQGDPPTPNMIIAMLTPPPRFAGLRSWNGSAA